MAYIFDKVLKMKQGIKEFIHKHCPTLHKVAGNARIWLSVKKSLRHTTWRVAAMGKVNKDIIGVGNIVEISEGTIVDGLEIHIRGNDNRLLIGKNCRFGTRCSIWLEGNNIEISIGEGSTFTTLCHVNAQEDGTRIEIGSDCMLSNNIVVRTSDSHPIYDLKTRERLNPAESVKIGNHVWIAPNSKIMKGSHIANGCIVGSDTTVTKDFTEENSLIVGRPAKVIRRDVWWTREKLF